MITQEQLDVLRELEQDERKMYHHTADALAAAIATIEGLPVDKNGVRLIPLADEVTCQSMQDNRWLGVEWFVDDSGKWFVIDSWAEEVGGLDYMAVPVSECALAAKGGGDA